MKRNLLFFFTVAYTLTAVAQGSDTIWVRTDDYLLPGWYDQCQWYLENPGLTLDEPAYFSSEALYYSTGHELTMQIATPRRIAIGGVAVMTAAHPGTYTSVSTEKVPETVTIHTSLTGNPPSLLATTRWDTATPRIMMLPQTYEYAMAGNTTGSLVFPVYEAYFDHPVQVDSAFYIMGTFYSNELFYEGDPPHYKYQPTVYGTVTNGYVPNRCDSCMKETTLYVRNCDTCEWWPRSINVERSGPFLVIPADLSLTVLPADTTMGDATGSGIYKSGTPVVVTATPKAYCRFDHWSDGSTANPRIMYLYQDTTVTAYFRNDSSNYVRVLVNNPEWGSASGTGLYPYGDTVTIEAIATEGYTFTEWADGDTTNPRTVVPVSDTVFTALFDPVLGIEAATTNTCTIAPNPTLGSVSVTMSQPDTYIVNIYDNAGRRVAGRTFRGQSVQLDISHLPKGNYTVTVQSHNMRHASTLIKL